MHSVSIKKEIFGKVFTAASLDEVRSIEAGVHKFSFVSAMLRFSVWIRVVLFNTLLYLLHFLWFNKRTPRDSEIKKIIVYVQGMLGDTAVHLPSIYSLKKKYPHASLMVVSFHEQFHLDSLLRPLPYIDHLILLDDQPVIRSGFTFNYSSEQLHQLTCDLFVNFSPFGNRGVPGFVLREMIFAHKTKAKFAFGFRLNSIGRRGLLNTVQHYFVKNEPRRGKEIVAPLHLSESVPSEVLPIQQEIKRTVLEKINISTAENKKIIVMHPGSKFLIKCWWPERFGEIAVWLKESYNAVVCITGLPHEEEIATKAVEASRKTAVNLCGKTSQAELIELLRLSSLCVTNDTGTMHLAALLDVPTVALFNTRLSVTHWFPNTSKVRALFSFDHNSYSFKDDDMYDPQMDAIAVENVKKSIEDVLQ